MNGEDMLSALSYIDEEYIAEADTVKLSHKRIWLKVGSAAACAFLLIGAFYFARPEKMLEESMDGESQISAGGVAVNSSHSGHRGTEDKTEECQENMEPSSYLVSTQIIRTDGGSEDVSYPFVTVLRSRQELEDYCHAQGEIFDLESGFLDACKAYDARFFTENDLILLCLEETSGSVTHQVTDLRWDGGEWILTVIRNLPPEGTDDMAQWHILIEVQMGKVIAPESKITVRLENKEG